MRPVNDEEEKCSVQDLASLRNTGESTIQKFKHPPYMNISR
jgi:hypothetical protein